MVRPFDSRMMSLTKVDSVVGHDGAALRLKNHEPDQVDIGECRRTIRSERQLRKRGVQPRAVFVVLGPVFHYLVFELPPQLGLALDDLVPLRSEPVHEMPQSEEVRR